MQWSGRAAGGAAGAPSWGVCVKRGAVVSSYFIAESLDFELLFLLPHLI